jgi:short-subunit dehydrogenase
MSNKLAVVTGASTGIGLELAKQCAEHGYDLIIAADEATIEQAADEIRRDGIAVEALVADLSTTDDVDLLYQKINRRPVAALLANAGRGLGKAFLDQRWNDIRYVIDTNITGTVYLIHRILNDMRSSGEGKLLLTGSIAGFIPGSYQAVYNGTKAFIDSFSYALREELRDTRITVTCLMPGPTETEFFRRADLMDTKVGQSEKDDPADVAEVGFKAMMNGDASVVAGLGNKLQAIAAHVMPASLLAKQHTKQTEPGSADN